MGGKKRSNTRNSAYEATTQTIEVTVLPVEANVSPYAMTISVKNTETNLKNVFGEERYWRKVFGPHTPVEPPTFSVYRKGFPKPGDPRDLGFHILLLKCEGHKFPRNLNAQPLEAYCSTHFYGPLIIALNLLTPPYTLVKFSPSNLEIINKLNASTPKALQFNTATTASTASNVGSSVPTSSSKKTGLSDSYGEANSLVSSHTISSSLTGSQTGATSGNKTGSSSAVNSNTSNQPIVSLEEYQEYLSQDNFYIYRYKTIYCPQKHLRHSWASCPYAHRNQDYRRAPDKYNYRPEDCQFMSKEGGEGCPHGLDCEYAHTTFERLYHPLKYKTHSCDQTNRNGTGCTRGDTCAFYHNTEERRYVNDYGDFDPFFDELENERLEEEQETAQASIVSSEVKPKKSVSQKPVDKSGKVVSFKDIFGISETNNNLDDEDDDLDVEATDGENQTGGTDEDEIRGVDQLLDFTQEDKEQIGAGDVALQAGRTAGEMNLQDLERDLIGTGPDADTPSLVFSKSNNEELESQSQLLKDLIRGKSTPLSNAVKTTADHRLSKVKSEVSAGKNDGQDSLASSKDGLFQFDCSSFADSVDVEGLALDDNDLLDSLQTIKNVDKSNGKSEGSRILLGSDFVEGSEDYPQLSMTGTGTNRTVTIGGKSGEVGKPTKANNVTGSKDAATKSSASTTTSSSSEQGVHRTNIDAGGTTIHIEGPVNQIIIQPGASLINNNNYYSTGPTTALSNNFFTSYYFGDPIFSPTSSSTSEAIGSKASSSKPTATAKGNDTKPKTKGKNAKGEVVEISAKDDQLKHLDLGFLDESDESRLRQKAGSSNKDSQTAATNGTTPTDTAATTTPKEKLSSSAHKIYSKVNPREFKKTNDVDLPKRSSPSTTSTNDTNTTTNNTKKKAVSEERDGEGVDDVMFDRFKDGTFQFCSKTRNIPNKVRDFELQLHGSLSEGHYARINGSGGFGRMDGRHGGNMSHVHMMNGAGMANGNGSFGYGYSSGLEQGGMSMNMMHDYQMSLYGGNNNKMHKKMRRSGTGGNSSVPTAGGANLGSMGLGGDGLGKLLRR